MSRIIVVQRLSGLFCRVFPCVHLALHLQEFGWVRFSSTGPIDGILSCATTPSKSRPGSNGNEWLLHITQSSRVGASWLDYLMSSSGHLVQFGEVLPLYKDAIGVFYNPHPAK